MEKEKIEIGDIVYILGSDIFLDAIEGKVIEGRVESISHRNGPDLFIICDKMGNTHAIYYPTSNSQQRLVTRARYLEMMNNLKQVVAEMMEWLSAIQGKIEQAKDGQSRLCGEGYHIYGDWENKSPSPIGIDGYWCKTCTLCGHESILGTSQNRKPGEKTR